jgi:electron transport complex protein RnfE
MGLAATFVLVCSNVIVAIIMLIFKTFFKKKTYKRIQKIRIPIFIMVIATFVTITEMVMAAYFPGLSESLGIFIPLIAVNCIILGRAEAFASKNGVTVSFVDGLGMGIGFTWALTLLGCIREFLGAGKIFGAMVLGTSYEPALLMVLAPGAFISLGLLLGLFNYLDLRQTRKEAGP